MTLPGFIHAVTFSCLLAFASHAFAVELNILGLFRNKAIVTIDGKQRVLVPGKPSPEGVLLISSNSSQAVIEIDGERETYKLGSHISTSFKRDKQPSVSIFKNEHGMFSTVGSINNFPVNFLVDTGASHIAMSRNEARRLGIDYRQYGQPGWAQTASGVVPMWKVKLDKVTVGKVSLTNVTAIVNESDSPHTVLLGMSFLGQLEMKNNGEQLQLKKKY